MSFKTIVRIKFAGSTMDLECEERDSYTEARNDGETSKAIWGDEFIDYKIVEV